MKLFRMTVAAWLITCVACFAALADEAKEDMHFRTHVAPLLTKYCIECHRPGNAKGELNLTTKVGFEKGGTSGELVDGLDRTDLEFSLLYERIISTDENARMPPKRALSKKQVELVRQWIRSGAKWPDDVSLKRRHANDMMTTPQ